MKGILSRILELYKNAGPRARLHLLIRYLTCPFLRLESLLPKEGKIVGIGCGHGLFTNMMALTSDKRTLVGIDIDVKKIELAKQTVKENRRVSFKVADFLQFDEGNLDCIAIIDVLYLIPYKKQEMILRKSYDLLRPGGVLLIKTMDKRPRIKYAINVLQEYISVKLTRITRGDGLFFRKAIEFRSLLAGIGFEAQIIPIHKRYTHPHCCILCRKPLPSGAADTAR